MEIRGIACHVDVYTKYIIIETREDSVVVKSNGLGPVLAAIMHPGRLSKHRCARVLPKKKAQNRCVGPERNLLKSE